MGLDLQIGGYLHNHPKSGELLLEVLSAVESHSSACIRIVAIARQQAPWALFYGEVVVGPEPVPGPNLDLGRMKVVSENLTVPEFVARLREALDTGRLRCNSIDINTTKLFEQWSFHRYASTKDYSRWPCVVAESWRVDEVDGHRGPFASLADGRYFRDGIEVISHVTTLPVFHGVMDARRGMMSVIIEDRRARISRIERQRDTLRIDVDGRALGDLVLSGQLRHADGGRDELKIDVAPELHHPLTNGPVDVDVAIFDREAERLDHRVEYLDAAPVLEHDVAPCVDDVGSDGESFASAPAQLALEKRKEPVRVFITYTHEGPRHEQSVVDLTARLREDGIDAWIDKYSPAPAEGWPRWMQAQVEESDFVLLICTRTYKQRFEGRETPGKGKGVTWEGLLATQLIYDNDSRNEKLVPVLLGDADENHVPHMLRPYTRYRLPDEYEEMYQHLVGMAGIPVPPVGAEREPRRNANAEPLPAQPVQSEGMPEAIQVENGGGMLHAVAEVLEDVSRVLPATSGLSALVKVTLVIAVASVVAVFCSSNTIVDEMVACDGVDRNSDDMGRRDAALASFNKDWCVSKADCSFEIVRLGGCDAIVKYSSRNKDRGKMYWDEKKLRYLPHAQVWTEVEDLRSGESKKKVRQKKWWVPTGSGSAPRL